jgi:nitrate reductase NapE component
VPKRNIYRDGARVYQEGRRFLGFVVPAVLKPARTLWHEIIGFVFVMMAMLAIGVALLGGYGISSFLRARRISRS